MGCSSPIFNIAFHLRTGIYLLFEQSVHVLIRMYVCVQSYSCIIYIQIQSYIFKYVVIIGHFVYVFEEHCDSVGEIDAKMQGASFYMLINNLLRSYITCDIHIQTHRLVSSYPGKVVPNQSCIASERLPGP